MENINKKIIDIKYKMLRKEQLLRHKKDIVEKIQTEKDALQRLKKELDKEEADVSRLEKMTISALIQSLNGARSLRLEKEKAEVARAALDYKQKQGDVEYLEYQLNLLKTELKDYDSLDRDLEEYIELKKKMIPNHVRSQIREMEAKSIDLQIKNKENREAEEICEKVISSLNSIIEHMDSYMEDSSDPLFVYPEHEELSDMMKEVSVFKGLWESLKKELDDTGMAFDIQHEESLMDSFSRYLYLQEEDRDIVTENVHNSYAHLTSLYGNLKNILNTLRSETEKNKYLIDDLNMEIKKIIEEN